ncbi:MAG TPA: phage tail protein [Acidisphaera sp.]|nr:phage tail protein [Acidisphaera sp.]
MSGPPSFLFTVHVDGSSGSGDVTFQEASGLGPDMDVEAVRKDGENRFVHALPKGVTHSNLVLKRGVADVGSDLLQWCKAALETDLSQPVETKTLTLRLLDETGAALRVWSFQNACPLRWRVDAFQADKNAVTIETIELTYSTVLQTL